MSGRESWAAIAAQVNGDASQDDLDEANAEIERLRAELADVREDLAIVELERDELRGAIVTHRRDIWSAIGRYGSKMDRKLWEAIR